MTTAENKQGLAGQVLRLPPVLAFARSRLAAWLVGHLIKWRLEDCGGSSDPKAIRVLMFSAFRFRQDISVLAGHPRLRVFGLPPEFPERVRSLFQDKTRTPAKVYFLEDDEVLLALRERQIAYIEVIARVLAKHVDVAMTPSIQYWVEQPWMDAFHRAKLPFIGLHKEFTVLSDTQMDLRVATHRDRRQKFLGTELYVTNEKARSLFTRADVAPAEKIKPVGLLRMDRLFRPDSPFRQRQGERPQAVLFSFGHFSGGLGSDQRRSHYFSLNDDFGFVRLFREVHVAFAELALENPDADFTYKLKNTEAWWVREIEAVLRADLGKGLEDIPNLAIRDVQAPALIRDAHAVVGFNSTVLLESQSLDRSTIIPFFAEAPEELRDYVYLQDYFDIFAIARSREDLKEKVRTALAEPDAFVPRDRDRWHAMMREYLGFDDGRTLDRLVANIERCLTDIKVGTA